MLCSAYTHLMSAERVTLAGLLGDLSRATDGEIHALQKILWALDREESSGEGYRSGVDMGAFSAYSLMSLEQRVQACVHLFEMILGDMLESEDIASCRKPLFVMGAQSSFDGQLRIGVRLLAERKEALRRIEKAVLDAPPEKISEMIPEDMRQQIQEELETEIGKLTQ